MNALVIAAHGSLLHPAASEPARTHARRIREQTDFDEVQVAFWKEQPNFREVLRTLTADTVYIVPLFISEGYFTERVLPREFDLDEWDISDWNSDGTSAQYATYTGTNTERTIHYCGPVGTHPIMTSVVRKRARLVTASLPTTESIGLALIGHGTDRNPHSQNAIYYHASTLRDQNLFKEVQPLFLDANPRIAEFRTCFSTSRIVCVPLFIADGYHTQEDIPNELGIPSYTSDQWVPSQIDTSLKLNYNGAIGTNPDIAGVIVQRAIDAGAQPSLAENLEIPVTDPVSIDQ